MGNLSKELMETVFAKGFVEGRAEGKANGIISSIANLMDTMGLSIEQAMMALKVTEDEFQKYIALLEKGHTTDKGVDDNEG